MEKLKFFVMIDDDPVTNVFHEIILKEADICENYRFYESPIEALNFFKDEVKSGRVIIPSILFLDVNMPEISGWEFLDELLNIKINDIPVVIMLTTSLSANDRERSEKYGVIRDFCNKPLTVEYLHDLVAKVTAENK